MWGSIPVRRTILIALALSVAPSIGRTAAAQEPPAALARLIEEALARNPELRALEREVEAARQAAPQARAPDDPVVSITQWSIPSSFAIGRADETWFGLTQAIPFPGTLALRGETAAARAAALEQMRQTRRVGLIAQVKRAYYRLALTDRMVALHREHEALIHQLVAIADERYALGQATQQDVLRGQLEQAELHNSLVRLERERAALAAALNATRDQTPESDLGLPELPPVRAVTLEIEAVQRAAMQDRPDVRSARSALDESGLAERLARKERLPEFMLGLSYWDVHGGENRWMVEGRMSLPWIFSGKYDARARQAAAEADRAEAQLAAARNQARLEATEAYLGVKAAERLVVAYQSGLLIQAEQALAAARIAYQAGRAEFMALIDAERALRELQLAAAEALFQFHDSLAALQQAVGVETDF